MRGKGLELVDEVGFTVVQSLLGVDIRLVFEVRLDDVQQVHGELEGCHIGAVDGVKSSVAHVVVEILGHIDPLDVGLVA